MDLNALRGQHVLVTGAAGFLGTYLLRRLAEVGAIVRGADRSGVPLRVEGVEQVSFDLTDPDTWGPMLEGQEVVYHLAAWIGRPGDDPSIAIALNVDAVRDLVMAAQAAGVRRFVLISTVAVYGVPEDDLITEDTPFQLDPDDPYGRTKAMGEIAAREAATGIELVIVRPGMIHGPGARNWTVKMAELVRDGVPTVLGPGDGHVFPVFIDNLIDAMLLAGSVPEAAGHAFHIVDGPVTWKAWMDGYGRIVGRKPRKAPVWLASIVGWFAERLPLGIALSQQHVRFTQRKLVMDTTRAREVLGWEPRVSLDQAMDTSAAWLREQGILPGT